MRALAATSRWSWIEARYNFFNSPEGRFLLGLCLAAFALIYGASLITFLGLYDKELKEFAQQVCDPGWKLTHRRFSAVGILEGSSQSMPFRYAVYGKGRQSRAHLLSEGRTVSEFHITPLNRANASASISIHQKVRGFYSLFASVNRVPWYVCSLDTRPVGFGSAPGADLLISGTSYFDPDTFKKNLMFLQDVRSGTFVIPVSN